MQQKLPNATATLVLGILSIVSCCCFGLPGLVFGIIALVISQNSVRMYRENPSEYSDYGNLQAGRVMAIIGIVLSSFNLIRMIVMLIIYGTMGYDSFMDGFDSGDFDF
ncbi:MAG: CCC motif membrane protein [Bacteroidota bacterium]